MPRITTSARALAPLAAVLLLGASPAQLDDETTIRECLLPAPREVPDATPASADEMSAYSEPIPGSEHGIDLVAIPGGSFLMGSPEGEDDRRDWEGPQREVELAPFWMGRTEITWDQYHVFMFKTDLAAREAGQVEAADEDRFSDAVSRPTPPYVPMDFDMGVDGFPAICMTQFAAKQFTMWLSMKTGRFYRLPTEAEWEYACRAGTSTAYSFGDDPDALEDHAWYFDNADDSYQLVAQKEPNPWGLYDMHGNVSEWCLDAFGRDGYALGEGEGPLANPVSWPSSLYPRVVRGGSWDDDPENLRSATRIYSRSSWKVQDPQIPKSIWYHTDARMVGFRSGRPLVEPMDDEKLRYWEADLEEVREIQARQRRGER